MGQEIKIPEEWDGFRKKVDRMDWTEYFILQAYLVSTRSLDSQTKCGCVITNQDKRIISTGYNSFVANIDDSVLPNVRPEKYDFFLHAEKNAILSCARSGNSCNDCVAYITTIPCIACLQDLYQAGISEIYYPKDTNVANMTKGTEYLRNFDILQKLMSHKIKIYPIIATDKFLSQINAIKQIGGV